ncbi:Uncharacterized protein QTN25_002566 [Entamoeba marina]
MFPFNGFPPGRASFMRMKKRQSRDEEASFANAYLYLLITEFDANATLKYTKCAKKTVKLYSVESITIDGKCLSQTQIRQCGRELLQQHNQTTINLSYTTMSSKQQKRSIEAEMSNGYLKLLIERGFIPSFKQTKTSKKTVKMIRTAFLKNPIGVVYNKELLFHIGVFFDRTVQNGFKGYKTLILNKLFVKDIMESVSANKSSFGEMYDDDDDFELDDDDDDNDNDSQTKQFFAYGRSLYKKSADEFNVFVSFDNIPSFHMEYMNDDHTDV